MDQLTQIVFVQGLTEFREIRSNRELFTHLNPN